MTGTRVKPAQRNEEEEEEEEGDGKDGREGGGSQTQIQTYSLAADSVSSLWLCGKKPGVSSSVKANGPW